MLQCCAVIAQTAAKTMTTAINDIANTQRIVPNVTPARAWVVVLMGAWFGDAGSGLAPGTKGSLGVLFIIPTKPLSAPDVSTRTAARGYFTRISDLRHAPPAGIV